MMNKKRLIFIMLLGLFLAAPTAVRAQVVVEKSTEIVTISDKQYYMHHVKSGDTVSHGCMRSHRRKSSD